MLDRAGSVLAEVRRLRAHRHIGATAPLLRMPHPGRAGLGGHGAAVRAGPVDRARGG